MAFLLLAVIMAGCGPLPSENGRTANELLPGVPMSIPGTHVLMAPPVNFVLALDFQGFDHAGKQGVISVTDLTGANFYERTATLSRAELEAQAITVFAYQDTVVAGYSAKYVHIESENDTQTHQLIFGDDTFSTTVTGMFVADDITVGEQIRDALFSTVYDKSITIDPVATAIFTVDESESKFKFASYTGNVYSYTVNGKISPTMDEDAAISLTPVASINGVTDDFAGDFAKKIMARLDENGLVDRRVKNESTQRINGYDAYEAEVYGKLQGVETVMYVVHLSNDQVGVFIHGIANTDYAENLAEFKKFTHALRFKASR